MFKWNRVLVALIGVPLLFFVYMGEAFFHMNLQGLPMLIFTNLVVAIGVYEFYKMVKISGKEVYDKFGILVSIIIPNLIYLANRSKYLDQSMVGLVIIIATMSLLIYRVFKNQIKGTLEKVSFTILGIVYVSVFFSQIINLYFLGAIFPFVLQVLVWISDTAAGIVGVAIGRKFFKNGFTEISPKKSVEGALGSIIFTAIAFVGIVSYFEKIKDVSLEEGVVAFLIGAFISVVAQIGDLIESLFKRECGVKDSGTILMGHGGILDRFDSMILVLPFVTVVIYFFHLCISYKYGI